MPEPLSAQLARGRSAFGADPALYASARPDYPSILYDWIEEICGISGMALFEVGPGTGMATARLLERDPASLLAIEPDARLTGHLGDRFAGDPRLTLLTSSFEDARLAAGAFDLGTAAMSFHWLDQPSALAKVHAALRSGGWWAMWWNVYGDPETSDGFAQAARTLFESMPTMRDWDAGRGSTFTLEVEDRLADLRGAGFNEVEHRMARWPVVMDADQIAGLAATWSVTARMAAGERDALLDGLRTIVRRDFGGRVERTFLTPLYVGRKPEA